MRSLLAGLIVLLASMPVATAQAQNNTERLPSYGSMQAPIGHRQPTQYILQPTQDDLKRINKDNQQLDLPASQNDMAGAGSVPGEEDALTKRIEQSDPRLDTEIRDICPSCGNATDAPVLQRWSPIYYGFDHQPTEAELRALRQEDVTPAQAQQTDRLYDELMSGSSQLLRRHPARAP